MTAFVLQTERFSHGRECRAHVRHSIRLLLWLLLVRCTLQAPLTRCLRACLAFAGRPDLLCVVICLLPVLLDAKQWACLLEAGVRHA